MFNDLQMELAQYISVIIGLIFSLIMRDLLGSFINGLSFYIDRNFHEGDNIILDGEEAIIVKIGFMRTIFRYKKTGNWFFVHNDRIKYLNLEKKVED